MKAKRRSSSNSFYSYSAKRSLRQEEVAAYRRIALATVIVVGLIVGGYFLGVPILANLGNTSSNQNLQLGSTDNVAPAPPLLTGIPDHTNQGTLTISGSAESGATVTVMVNDQEGLSTIVDGQGLFEGKIELSGGENHIMATATDAAGNQSRESNTVTVVYDATPPSLVLLQNIPETVAEASLTISGKTEPNAKVTVNQRRSIVDANGVFSTTIQLQDGSNEIIILATDAASNENSIKRTVTLEGSGKDAEKSSSNNDSADD